MSENETHEIRQYHEPSNRAILLTFIVTVFVSLSSRCSTVMSAIMHQDPTTAQIVDGRVRVRTEPAVGTD